ncbi:MAG TPA: tail fiber domain-containing protein [Phnomibacter sp.]|nr:tail fiber domain-containing protein [Phnomibacter sp.]
MKTIASVFATVLMTTALHAQNIGINNDTSKPLRAKLEVWGVAGTGKTTAYFDPQTGISLHRNYAGIGMNQYFDNTTNGRYMANGWAAVWKFIHDDAGLANGLSLTHYPSGTANTELPAGTRVWHFTRNNRFQILTTGAGGSAELDVGRGGGGDGTAVFMGTTYWSHFNFSSGENTYIRGGKAASNLILNDIVGGKVVFGNGSNTVGVNTNGYVPPTTLEVRQIGSTGIEFTSAAFPAEPWELRVADGASPHFYLRYMNNVRTYFSYVDGSLHPVSDARIKTNVQPLGEVLEKLMQLQPVSYMKKNAVQGQQRSIGFIAQQVQPLFPLLVSPGMGESGDMLGLNYSGFNVIAVKGIQEEQAQMDALDKELAGIDKRLKVVEQKIASPKK